MWQVSQQANLVLAKMYPEHADVFSSIDHRVPNRTNRVSEVVATRLIARLILTAIINLNGDPNHVAGAKQMYTAIPQPIPYSNTPFSGDGWSVSALNVGRRSRDGGIDPASLTGPMDALPHPDAKDKPDVDQ
ncbi:MAG: hypothetical protein KDA58_00420 [Planctomycetaceae bacterium]|nr:hypothetical protein [Planctomycetaceae bacterium]